MPTGNGYNTGADSTVILMGVAGRIDLDGITDFEHKPVFTETKTRPLGRNAPLHDDIPDGHEGSFSFTRKGTKMDDLVTTAEAAFYATGILSKYNLFHVVIENGGKTSTWAWDNVVVKMTEGGSYKNNEEVKQKVTFKASTWKRVA